MQSNLSIDELTLDITEACTVISESDSETIEAWLKSKIEPVKWKHNQYKIDENFWVIATLNNSCLYFNFIEEGWGWGKFCSNGFIAKYHWEQERIYEAFIWRYKDQGLQI